MRAVSPMAGVVVVALAALTSNCVGTPMTDLPLPEDFEEQWHEWRDERRRDLTAEDGWLSLTGLIWLKSGVSTLGLPSSDADVILPVSAGLPSLPDHLGSITIGRGDPETPNTRGPVTATFDCTDELSQQLEATRPGDVACRSVDLLATDERGGLSLGSVEIIAMDRGGHVALRIRDSSQVAELADRLPEIPTFPLDPRWVLAATFEPAARGETFAVPNVTERTYDQSFAGTISFSVGGETYRIGAIGAALTQPLLLVIGDATNGTETYGGGRYIYVDVSEGSDDLTLDLNRLYNPPCVFTDFATCPLAPPQNRLPIRVEAGERVLPKQNRETV